MAKKKKTYIIMGRSSYGTEEIDECDDLKEARRLLREYQMCMPTYVLWIK